MGELAAFLGIAILVIVTPGQDTALTIRNTMLGGRPAGVATAGGVAAGQACWTAAASIGLAALLVASEPVFVALRLAGAAYLVYLGLQALRHAVRPGSRTAERVEGAHWLPRAFRQGLLSNLGNPKMAIFFTSLLPQFGSSFGRLLALGLLLACSRSPGCPRIRSQSPAPVTCYGGLGFADRSTPSPGRASSPLESGSPPTADASAMAGWPLDRRNLAPPSFAFAPPS